MSDQKQRHPAIIRTSPKGVPDFVGRCPACGKQGLTWDDFKNDECPNPQGMTQERALIGAILGDFT